MLRVLGKNMHVRRMPPSSFKTSFYATQNMCFATISTPIEEGAEDVPVSYQGETSLMKTIFYFRYAIGCEDKAKFDDFIKA